MRRLFSSSVAAQQKKKLPDNLPKFQELVDEFEARSQLPDWRGRSYSPDRTKPKETPKTKSIEAAGKKGKPRRKENTARRPKKPAENDEEEENVSVTLQEESLSNPSSIDIISSKEQKYSRYLVPNQPPVPPLANNLDKVLFNPGVHFLKDSRSNVYNFPPSLENIMSIRDFDFAKIPQFVPSGKDNRLAKLAQQEKKKYTGSTSSVTGVLGHLHKALSYGRPPSLMGMSKYFKGNSTTFTAAQRMPTQFILQYNEETQTHAVAPPGEGGDETVLTLLGQAMETMLVTDTEEFANYDRLLSHSLPKEDPTSTYNYMESGPFLFRSQLDCHDPRLPGTGYFDLKTRAVCAVRHDIDYAQVKDGCDYQIIKRDGTEESYAREYFELIRSALFKYSLQARIGSMDGIFVAYHNINNLFGFEYLPLEDIDVIFHTSHMFLRGFHTGEKVPSDMQAEAARVGPLIAEKEFALSLGVLEKLLDKISSQNPKGSFMVHVRGTGQNGLQVLFGEITEESEEELMKPNTENIPPLSGFRCVLKSSVNGVEVKHGQFPHIDKQEDVWDVSLEIEEVSGFDVVELYSSFLKENVSRELTSKPSTSRSPQDKQLEKEGLDKLEDPTPFQQKLRRLQAKGKLYKEWTDKREKIVWIPKADSH